MLAYLRRILQRDDGASAVEYGLLVAAIAAVLVVVLFVFGTTLKNKFSDTCGKIAANSTSTAATNCG